MNIRKIIKIINRCWNHCNGLLSRLHSQLPADIWASELLRLSLRRKVISAPAALLPTPRSPPPSSSLGHYPKLMILFIYLNIKRKCYWKLKATGEFKKKSFPVTISSYFFVFLVNFKSHPIAFNFTKNLFINQSSECVNTVTWLVFNLHTGQSKNWYIFLKCHI